MKIWIKKIFGFGLASFFSDFSHEMTISLIPILVVQFVGASLAPFYLGLIAGITETVASFLRIFSGFLTDRLLKKKPLIMIGYAMSALFSMLVGFAHSIWALMTYRTLSFIGSGLREPPRDALIAATINVAHYGRAFGLRNAMDTLGSLVGPLVTLLLMNFFSIYVVFLLSFIPGILAVVSIAFLTDEAVLQRRMPRELSIKRLWYDLALLPGPFLVLLSILFIFNLGWFNKLLLIARTQEIIVADKNSTATLLVVLYAIFNTVRALSEIVIGFISDYVSRILLLAIFGCGSFAVVAFLLTTPQASLHYCILLFAISGLSAATLLTLKKACAADMLPADIRGLGYGVLQATEGLTALVANIFIGFLWTYYSSTIVFVYVIITSLIAMILLFCFDLLKRRFQ